jgi:ribosome-associated protein
MLDEFQPSRTPSEPRPEITIPDHLPEHLRDSYRLAMLIAEAMDDRKGHDIAVLNVSDVSYLADYFVLVTGFSNAQVRAIARSVDEKVEDVLQRTPRRTEGQQEGSWILIDYGDVIAHIFMPNAREFYGLEAFWGHAERISLPTGA